MDELIKLLDKNLICKSTKISTDSIYFYVESTRKNCTCPNISGFAYPREKGNYYADESKDVLR